MSDFILRSFPLGFPWETLDPFLFCVYHLDHYPKGNEDMTPVDSLEGRNLGNDFVLKDGWRMYHGHSIPGFPYHPHRGFETITIVNKGYCDHSDSLGAAGRFGQGDVQWMTAGRGVQHSEMFPLLNTDKDNPLELFQIWLNLPKMNKFVDPHFKMLWHEDIVEHTENGVTVRYIAGLPEGENGTLPAPNSWASDKDNQVAIWNIRLEPGSEFILPTGAEDINSTLYFYEGDTMEIAGNQVAPNHGFVLNNSQQINLKSGSKTCHMLLLKGKPIGEPVAKYGPFVMNTQEEVQQAMQEYKLTQFGGWPWPQADHVHAKDRGRFAKYPDGTLVEK